MDGFIGSVRRLPQRKEKDNRRKNSLGKKMGRRILSIRGESASSGGGGRRAKVMRQDAAASGRGDGWWEKRSVEEKAGRRWNREASKIWRKEVYSGKASKERKVEQNLGLKGCMEEAE